jgi:hypothetical protein
MLENFSEGRTAPYWRSATSDNHTWLMDRSVNSVANLHNLFFSIQVSSDDVIGLDERIQLSLQVLVLLGQQERVLLKSLIFRFKVKISIHECLVGVVHSFQVSVLASLIYFKTVEFSLKAL